ncbi:MAG: hypothetical protein IJR90_06555 [Clostridia bacterium]|nr:hypothetical protein [Clostridia bacterium]
MEDPNKIKIKFKRSRVILTAVYAVICAAVYSAAPFVPEEHPYLRQLTVFVGTVLLIITLVSFFKLFTYEIRRELYRRITVALFNAGKVWRTIKKSVRRFLGLPDRVDLKGEDERTIVFDGERRRRRDVKRKKVKYSDLDSNRTRIRFLFAKYIIEHTAKEDPPEISDTPSELGRKLPEGEESSELIGIYLPARYAPDRFEVTTSDVERIAGFVGTSGKI